jgi:hypothetical protein
MMKRATVRVGTIRAQQIAAAKLRLQEELGRFLICTEPDTDDLNGKLHRMTQDRTATAERLRRVSVDWVDTLSGPWPSFRRCAAFVTT